MTVPRPLLRWGGIVVCVCLVWGGAGKAQETSGADATVNEAVVLNFEGADIREVIHSLATALGINYLIDPRVQGQVTIRTTGRIARRDLFPLFHQILRSSGLAAVKVGEMYQIVPVGEAKTKSALVTDAAERRGAATEDAFVIELVKIEHLAAEEMAKVLQPFVSPGGDVIAYPRGNLVIITDLASNVARLKELVRAFDTDTFRDLHTRVFRIEHANVEDLGQELKEVLAPYGVTPKTAEERGVFIVPLTRLNAVVVVSFNPDVLAQVEQWIQILDVPPEKGGGRAVHVYAVENAKAADLAAVLGDLYGSEGGVARRRGERTGPTSGLEPGRERGDGATLGGTGEGGVGGRRRTTRRRERVSGAGPQSISITPREGERPIFKEEVRIVADDITNSLVILATPRDYDMIREVLRKLDVVPRQVLIEAVIVEVGLTGELRFGVEYAIATGGIGRLLGSGSGGTGSTGSDATGSNTGGTSSGGATAGGISDTALLNVAKRGVHVSGQGLFGFITDRDQFLLLVNALAAQSRLNILATPHVIAADNREAHILIGEQIPILTSTQQSTLAQANIVQSIQYRDTGKILTILPQVNSAGLVNMEIRQEVSDVGQDRFGGTNSPSFITREAETTVVVQNGESVLIGGIIDDNVTRTRRGVPFLMDVPVLGRLFRVESERVDRTELIILITPHVIRDRDEARAVTEEFEGRIRNLKQMLERVKRPKSEPQSAPPSP
ncbi:MAG: type II secretion system secretin GspD [Candidatus Binatia bacterium]|nr:type II secretion system secretin GspD [Candidatus Binatia bacterium]